MFIYILKIKFQYYLLQFFYNFFIGWVKRYVTLDKAGNLSYYKNKESTSRGLIQINSSKVNIISKRRIYIGNIIIIQIIFIYKLLNYINIINYNVFLHKIIIIIKILVLLSIVSILEKIVFTIRYNYNNIIKFNNWN